MSNQIPLKVFVKNTQRLLPKSYQDDIGIDIAAITPPRIVGVNHPNNSSLWADIDYIEYDTGIFIDSLQRYTPEQLFTLVFPRSSLSKRSIILANGIGVIDPNYRDSIKIRFKYLFQPRDFSFEDGLIYGRVNEAKIYQEKDQIAQLIFAKTIPVEIIYVAQLQDSDRGNGAFGHTDHIL